MNFLGTHVNIYASNPGIVSTNIGQHTKLGKSYLANIFFGPLWWVVSKSALQGIQTTLSCALDGDLEEESGRYYA